MPINQNREDPIPNYYAPNQNQRNKSQDVIAKLEYSDLSRDAAGTLHANDLMRVDMQDTFSVMALSIIISKCKLIINMGRAQ